MVGLASNSAGGMSPAVLVEPSVVKPIDPLGGGVLDLIDGAPRTPMFDHLGLVQAVDRRRERIIE
jgi:hypothetical protein